MKIKFKEKRTILSTNVNVLAGSFALDSSPLNFETCRERFGKMWDKDTKGFYFSHLPTQGKAIAAFIVKTEEILGKKRFSKFSETNRDRVLWIEPSMFWRCCRMRRSLFTILVRCGMQYSPDIDDYEKALYLDCYAMQTRTAIMRFLFGFTKYVGPSLETVSHVEHRGWKAVFGCKDEKYVRSTLVWPGKNPYKLESSESLWS